MAEKQLKDLIIKLTGRPVLYADDIKTPAIMIELLHQGRIILKEAELSSHVLDYLADRNLYVKVEYDMRSSVPMDREIFDDFHKFLENLLHSYPMLGLAVFNEQDRKTLFDFASQATRKLDFDNGQLTPQEQNALVMSTVQLLKDWRMDKEDDSSMWSFIYRQYGIREHDGYLSQKIYFGFQKAIESVMKRYNRFFAPPGTQRYYTTLMLHALAPKQSIHALFEILIRFFENNLRSQYLPNDPSYKVFVKRMKTRWGVPSDLERLGLYSASINSGLMTLFLNRSDYMVTLCDSIVSGMDQLMQNGSFKKENTKYNYLDELLIGWYQDKSRAVREKWTQSQREMVGERTITNAKDTNPLYVLHQGRVALMIPNIRLPSAEGPYPRIVIRQGDQVVIDRSLDVYGDELSRSIRKSYLYFDRIPLRFECAFDLNMQIILDGEIIFDSLDRLHRPFIFFNHAGTEIRPDQQRSGHVFLYAREGAELVSIGLDNAYQSSHPGQLIEAQMEILQDLRIDGTEVFLQATDKESLRIYPSRNSIEGAYAQRAGNQYCIYADSVYFEVHVPDTESPLSYVVHDTGNLKPLSSFKSLGQGTYLLRSQAKPGEFCELGIKHFISSSIVFSHKFIQLPSFSVKYTQPFFLGNHAKVEGTYSFIGVEEPFSVLLQGEETASVTTNDGRLSLMLYPPLLCCTMLGQELFSNNLLFWHGDIPKDTHLTPVIPNGWKADMVFGNQNTTFFGSSGVMDIGNQVSANMGKNQKESLWFLLIGPRSEREFVLACEIAFKPTFQLPPLFFNEGKLLWKAEANFIGDTKSSFFVKLMRGKEHIANYSLPNKDKTVDHRFLYEIGSFYYEVYLTVQSLFSRTEELIYQGNFALGDENQLRFDGQEVHLTSAVCWDVKKRRSDDIRINQNAAVIRDIRYLGHSVPSGEETSYPRYEGILQFYDHLQKEWQAFSSEEDSPVYEQINPVQFWPINDNMMIVYSCTGDGMCLDTSRNRLMYKQLDIEMHRELQRAIISFPDYYAYRKDET